MNPVYWIHCSCYVWPVAAFGRLKPCRTCGDDDYYPCDEPANGKAGPWTNTTPAN